MKTNKKIMIAGISLMLVTITLIGVATLGDVKQNAHFIKMPIFKLSSFGGIWDFGYPDVGSVSFNMYTENPNDEDIELQFLFFNILDENGTVLINFRPEINPNINCLQVGAESFTLRANENITVPFFKDIIKNSINEYCWSFLSTYPHSVRICGFYRLNGELNWFESNLCEVAIPSIISED